MGDERERRSRRPVHDHREPGRTVFAEYDRGQRRILGHLLLSFVLGLVFGVLGVLVTHAAARAVESLFNPYAYFLLAVYVGATASGLGWAALSALLAALAPMVSSMAGTLMVEGYDTDAWGGGSAIQVNVLLASVFCYGVAAYLARGRGLGADLLAGVLGGILLADGADKAAPGWMEYVPGFWPWPAAVLAVVVVIMVLLLRRTTAGRLRATAVTLALPAVVILLLPPS
ncbi:hypothetical protein [Spongiactinospora sp. TRM90649]|uniref:hypothetical protein n=1 Tax=Spongiactinospora sp. TRM90649 TaxID=3031114 RepID=UPI0023F730BB|nr:hypothetical protein [Spongiactinospora sp. TRM90649]MDF5753981.1 hypothetical protein [Spongiactinospora sp. TRM90649]